MRITSSTIARMVPSVSGVTLGGLFDQFGYGATAIALLAHPFGGIGFLLFVDIYGDFHSAFFRFSVFCRLAFCVTVYVVEGAPPFVFDKFQRCNPRALAQSGSGMLMATALV